MVEGTFFILCSKGKKRKLNVIWKKSTLSIIYHFIYLINLTNAFIIAKLKLKLYGYVNYNNYIYNIRIS